MIFYKIINAFEFLVFHNERIKMNVTKRGGIFYKIINAFEFLVFEKYFSLKKIGEIDKCIYLNFNSHLAYIYIE